MKYLHTMIRVKNLEESLEFFTEKLGLIETKRIESEAGKFTLIYLAASEDLESAKKNRAPEVELTYNWPDDQGKTEDYDGGRNFGHLAFRVKNIYKTCANLQEKGVAILRPPRDGNMAFIKTPDGISIEFLQEGPALEPQEPWLNMPNQGTW